MTFKELKEEQKRLLNKMEGLSKKQLEDFLREENFSDERHCKFFCRVVNLLEENASLSEIEAASSLRSKEFYDLLAPKIF